MPELAEQTDDMERATRQRRREDATDPCLMEALPTQAARPSSGTRSPHFQNRSASLLKQRLASGLWIVVSLLLAACGSGSGTGPSTRATALPVPSSAPSTVPPRPVVIDTDMAADD